MHILSNNKNKKKRKEKKNSLLAFFLSFFLCSFLCSFTLSLSLFLKKELWVFLVQRNVFLSIHISYVDYIYRFFLSIKILKKDLFFLFCFYIHVSLLTKPTLSHTYIYFFFFSLLNLISFFFLPPNTCFFHKLNKNK